MLHATKAGSAVGLCHLSSQTFLTMVLCLSNLLSTATILQAWFPSWLCISSSRSTTGARMWNCKDVTPPPGPLCMRTSVRASQGSRPSEHLHIRRSLPARVTVRLTTTTSNARLFVLGLAPTPVHESVHSMHMPPLVNPFLACHVPSSCNMQLYCSL